MSTSPSQSIPAMRAHRAAKQASAAWRARLRASARELDAPINLLRRGASMSPEAWAGACAALLGGSR